MGIDPRSSAAPLYNFRIVSAYFSSAPSPFRNAFQHPNTEKQTDLVGLGPFPNFRFFSFHFPPFFRSVFSGGSDLFGVGAFPRKPSPEHSVCFPTPRPLPNPKPLTQNSQTRVENATMQVNCCCWLPTKLSVNANTDALCVSTEATERNGQRTEALRACTHKLDSCCRSMTGVCTG